MRYMGRSKSHLVPIRTGHQNGHRRAWSGSGVTGGRSADFVASAYQSALVTDITDSGVHHHSGAGWSSVQEVPVLQQSPPGSIANAAPVPTAPLERTVGVAVTCAGKRLPVKQFHPVRNARRKRSLGPQHPG